MPKYIAGVSALRACGRSITHQAIGPSRSLLRFRVPRFQSTTSRPLIFVSPLLALVVVLSAWLEEEPMASDNGRTLPTRIEDLTTDWFRLALRGKYPAATLHDARLIDVNHGT